VCNRFWWVPACRARFRGLALGLLLLVVYGATLADHDEDEFPGDYGEHDHDWARHALSRGEVLPLAEILARVAAWEPGEVIEVEFERWGRRGERRWAYEFEIIGRDGRLREVYVDAATGEILETAYED